jgi:DNA-3-methyladenine glycosylase I
MTDKEMKKRCEWCRDDPLYVKYHDEEWGVPVHEDRHLFKMLTLEGAQAGLSWRTVLNKKENYNQAFHGFDYEKIADYTLLDIERLLENPGIIRNRLKIESAVKNARCILAIIDKFGSFDSFIWNYVDGMPIQNKWKCVSEIPSKTKQSDAMSKILKKYGFNFVGSTICYAFMQSVGMVNDHTTDCFRYLEIKRLSEKT